MRPLAVLLLILGATLALLFAVLSFTGDKGRVDASDRRIVQPANETAPKGSGTERIVSADGPLQAGGEQSGERSAVEGPAQVEEEESFENYLAGIVVAPDGEPLPEAKVELVRGGRPSAQLNGMIRMMRNQPSPTSIHSALTDASGAFRFDDLDPSKGWSVVVTHAQYAKKDAGPIEVPRQGGVRERIRLEEGYRIHGVVKSEATGAPIAGALVVLDNPAAMFLQGKNKSPERLEVRTKADGLYEFANLTPTSLTLACSAEGYAMQVNQKDTSFIGMKEQRSKQVDFELAEGLTIAGRVLAPDGTGVEGIVIDAFGHHSDPGCRGQATSGPNGEFLVAEIAEGLYTLRPVAKGWDVEPVRRVSSGETNVEIQLAAQGGVAGQVVRPDGRSLTAFDIHVRRAHPSNPALGHVTVSRSFRNRTDGSFELGGLSPGDYLVQADARNYASSFSAPFTVAQGRTTSDILVEMSLGGKLTGRVVDDYTGKPIVGATVQTNENNWLDSTLTQLFQATSATATTKTTVTTDADGRFEIALMTPETYQVKVARHGFVTDVKNDVAVLEGSETDVEFRMRSGATIRGTVFLPDGAVANGVDISLAAIPNNPGMSRKGRTDAEGRFVIFNAQPGEYRIAAARPQTPTGSPFERIADMKNSETVIQVVDRQEYTQDLYIGRK